MAQEDVVISVQVDGIERNIKSVKDLKQTISELQKVAEESDIGSKQQREAIETLEKLNEQLQEVTSSTKALAQAEHEAKEETDDLRKQFAKIEDELFRMAGTGQDNTEEFRRMTKEAAALNKRIDALNSSLGENSAGRASVGFQQLQDGFRNLDFDSVKKGFAAMRTAIAATGVLLLVQGVTYLIENFDELSKGSGILGKSLRAIGAIIDTIVDGVNWLTDAIGLTNTALDEMGENVEKNATKAKEALALQNAEYDRQIAVATASGEKTIEMEIAKQEAIIKTNKAIIDQVVTYLRAGGQITDEQRKLVAESLEAIKNAKNEEKVIEINHNKEIKAEKKKSYDDLLKLRQEYQKQLNDIEAQERQVRLDFNETLKAEKAAEDKKKLDEQIEKDNEDIENAKKLAARLKEIDDKAKADKLASDAAIRESQRVGLDAAKGLSEAFFAFQLNAAEGNEKKQLEIRKRMFQVDKAFNVARAVQDGIRSVQAALTIPPPGGQILAGVNAALAAANVAKILATKFDAGAGGGDAGNISAPSPVSLPTPDTTAAPNIQPTTTFDEQGRNTSNRVYVVESDITKTQNRVSLLEEQATIK